MGDDRKDLTNNFGTPIDDDQNTLTAGEPGPALIQDTHLIEKLAHFDRDAYLKEWCMPRALELTATSKSPMM